MKSIEATIKYYGTTFPVAIAVFIERAHEKIMVKNFPIPTTQKIDDLLDEIVGYVKTFNPTTFSNIAELLPLDELPMEVLH